MDKERRQIIKAGVALSLLPLGMVPSKSVAQQETCPIAKSGETLFPIGMGTWITFNVGRDKYLRRQRANVLKTFFEQGGQVIDSSPMYGSSEQVIGHALSSIRGNKPLFSATKTWSGSVTEGRQQFTNSQHLWGTRVFDLVQIHNLLAWREQLAMLRELKQQGLIRYLGVTTSHGRRHEELEDILKSEAIDFVQLTYNIFDREAENRLLPIAREQSISVIANRPLRGGSLMNTIRNTKLPAWYREAGCQNWAQFFLRFIVSHPAITCAIPATTRVDHMLENMGSVNDTPFPDEALRQKMANYWTGR